jgi:multicomponent Na+:H+ antiporter subunit D
MNFWIVLPLLVPLTFAIGSVLALPRPRLRRAIGAAGPFVLLAVSIGLFVQVWSGGIHAVQIGGWPAPFGITLVVDMFSAVMVLLAGVTGAAIAGYSLVAIDRRREAFGYYPLLNFLLMGVSGAFLTGDLFNLYVWFEVLLMASFVLLVLGGERAQTEGAVKYVTLNLLSSAVFLAGVGIVYGMTGTLNMADLAVKLAAPEHEGTVNMLAMLFLVAFGIKAAVFPLFFWLPASYHTPPAAVSALFAGLLTKVGVYALIRVFTLIFVRDIDFTHAVLLWVSGATMVTGVLGAVAQNEFRRILSFHIISQIGYMIMGLALWTPLALTGAVFYIVHHIVVKTNLFLIGGVAEYLRGTGELGSLGGLYPARPLLAASFIVAAMSLAGVPPLSGFFAKLILIQAGLEAAQYAIVVAALSVGLLTMLSMTKIWGEAFWKPRPVDVAAEKDVPAASMACLMAPVVALAILTLTIGLFPQFLLSVASRAAGELLDPAGYIAAVMGEP